MRKPWASDITGCSQQRSLQDAEGSRSEVNEVRATLILFGNQGWLEKKHGKIMEKYGKIMEKYGKHMGKYRKNMGK